MTRPRASTPDPGLREATVAVVGATGFLGRWTARALAAAGARVHLLARDVAEAQHVAEAIGGAAGIHACDVADGHTLRAALLAVKPAVTFNLAGYGVDRSERDVAESFRVNGEAVAGLCAAVEASRDRSWTGQALVHVGSQLEYGPIGGDLREGSAPRPDTVYGRSKLEGTRAVADFAAAHAMPAVVARVFTVYGAGERAGRLLPSLLEAARTGEPIALTAGTQRLDFIHVDDVVEALLRLALSRAHPGEVVNVATGRLVSVRAFAEQAAAILGISAGLLRFGALAGRAETVTYDPVAIERLRALTGWSPSIDVATGIRRTLELSKHGYVWS